MGWRTPLSITWGNARGPNFHAADSSRHGGSFGDDGKTGVPLTRGTLNLADAPHEFADLFAYESAIIEHAAP